MGPGRLDERSTDRYGDRAGDRGSHARRGGAGERGAPPNGYPPRSRSSSPGEYWEDELGGYVYNLESMCDAGKGKKGGDK